MRPFLVTELQAGKLPRWGLLLLCLLYIVPGFIGRDPWRSDDAAGFGVAWAMAQGGARQWLLPEIAGEAVFDEGPLPFWFGAMAIRVLPMLPAHVAMQLAAMLGLGLMFVAVWYASYRLARRPGVQPADPFGAGADPVDFGRAVADSALLVLMATVGLIVRLHETSAEAAQVVWVAVFLFSAAWSLERPMLAGLATGAALGATVLTRGLLPAVALAGAAVCLPLVSRAFRLVARRWLAVALPAGVLAGLAWPLALSWSSMPEAQAHLGRWLAWNHSQFAGFALEGLAYYARTAPWYFWPAWPVALWAIVRWRGRLDEPAVALPLVTLAWLTVSGIVGSAAPESQMPMLAATLAMLAAIGLPTLKRSVTSLIDWFAVMTYTVLGLVIWGYWLAFLTGFPPRMAVRAAALSPGYVPEWLPGALLLGLAATLAWLALVRWRLARHPPTLWRPVALSCGGLVLAWLLLMSLWMPAVNHRNTYRDLAARMTLQLPPSYRCLDTLALGQAQRATLHYFGDLRLGGATQRCDWLLVQDVGPVSRQTAPARDGWIFVWEGARPRDSDEKLRLYQRR
ncbi:MAG TPA: glycosyltransferase family 39 protein [Burkholderiaceae bacterium]|jgi:4-amino-4-deoxy-L-arabinose transferase-like glycosyltransferase|nr:glycosyltransferase family 39 protein [Burkholderiaceae bacterium]